MRMEAATRRLNATAFDSLSRSFSALNRNSFGISRLMRSANPAGGFGTGASVNFRCRSAFLFAFIVFPHPALPRGWKTLCAIACAPLRR